MMRAILKKLDGGNMLRRFGIFFALLGVLTNASMAGTQAAAPQTQDKPKPASAAPVAAPAQDQPKAAGAAPAPAKNDYSNGDNWLCRPGRQEACVGDLTATGVAADGELTRE